MIYGVIYLISNLVNGKKYVGQTTRTVEERFKEHAAADSAIGKAIQKYGVENFRYGVIVTCYSKEELDAQEIHYIAALKSKVPTGYNLTDGGDGIQGCPQEVRDKISAKKTGYKASDEARANMSAERVERYKDPAAHEVLSIAQKKRYAENPVTEETLAKRAETAKRHYDEHLEKRDAAGKRMSERWADPEGREKLLAGIEKRWENPEAHEKASAVSKARSVTPEAQERFAATLAKRWSDPAEHERMSALMKEIYSDPERLKQQSENSKRYHEEHPYTDADKARIAEGVRKYHAEHPESDETRAKKSASWKRRWAKIKTVRGLIIALAAARKESSPEMSAFLGALLKRFSLIADCLLAAF